MRSAGRQKAFAFLVCSLVIATSLIVLPHYEPPRGPSRLPARQAPGTFAFSKLPVAISRRRRLAGVTHVEADTELLEALRDPNVNVIVLTRSISLAESDAWKTLEEPVRVSRPVVILGWGRYGGSLQDAIPSGPYVVLDCAHLSAKIQLAVPPNEPVLPPAAGDATTSAVAVAAAAAAAAAAAPVVMLRFQGLWLVNHQPPSGFGMALVTAVPSSSSPSSSPSSPSSGAAVAQEDCVLERLAGPPLSYTETEAAALPPLPGQPATRFSPLPNACPPAAADASGLSPAPNTSCFTPALQYTHLAAVVPPEEEAGGTGDAAAAVNSAAASILFTISNSTYGVRYQASSACIQAYGPDYCVYGLQAQLQALTPAPGPSPRGGKGLSSAASAGIAVVATLAACGAVLLLVRFVGRIRKGHRTLTLAVRPPGATPNTTLLITDIQNSTNLWEQLPTNVMNEALRLHHRCLRSLLPKCNGYESATEGDSFILAFHTPMDASRFALLAQQALMELAWPVELLEHEDGREVWAEQAHPKVVSGRIGLPGSHHHHHHHHHHTRSLGLGTLMGGGYQGNGGSNPGDDDDEADGVGSPRDSLGGGPHQSQSWLSAAFGAQARSAGRRGMPGRGPGVLPRNRTLNRSFTNVDRPSLGPFAALVSRPSLSPANEARGGGSFGAGSGAAGAAAGGLPAALTRMLQSQGRSVSDAAVAAVRARQEILELLPDAHPKRSIGRGLRSPSVTNGPTGGADGAVAAAAAAAPPQLDGAPRASRPPTQQRMAGSLHEELTLLMEPMTDESIMMLTATNTPPQASTQAGSTGTQPPTRESDQRLSHTLDQGEEEEHPDPEQQPQQQQPQQQQPQQQQRQRAADGRPSRSRGQEDHPGLRLEGGPGPLEPVTVQEVQMPARGGGGSDLHLGMFRGGTRVPSALSRTQSSSGYSSEEHKHPNHQRHGSPAPGDEVAVGAGLRPAAAASASPASTPGRLAVGSAVSGGSVGGHSGGGSGDGGSASPRRLGNAFPGLGMRRSRARSSSSKGGSPAARAGPESGSAAAVGSSGGGEGEEVLLFPGWVVDGVDRCGSSSRTGGELARGPDTLVWSSNPLAALPDGEAADPPAPSTAAARGPRPPSLAPARASLPDGLQGLYSSVVLAPLSPRHSSAAASSTASPRDAAPRSAVPMLGFTASEGGARASMAGSSALKPVTPPPSAGRGLLAGPVAEGTEEAVVPVPPGSPSFFLPATQTECQEGGSVLLITTEEFVGAAPQPAAAAAATHGSAPTLAPGLHRKGSFGATAPLVPSRLGPRQSVPALTASDIEGGDGGRGGGGAGAGSSIGAMTVAAGPPQCTSSRASGDRAAPAAELAFRQLVPAGWEAFNPVATADLLALLVGSPEGPAAAADRSPGEGAGGGAAASSAVPPPAGNPLLKRATQELLIASSAPAVGGGLLASSEAETGELLLRRQASTDFSAFGTKEHRAAWASLAAAATRSATGMGTRGRHGAGSGPGPQGRFTPGPHNPGSATAGGGSVGPHSLHPSHRGHHGQEGGQEDDGQGRARPHTVHGYQPPPPAMVQPTTLPEEGSCLREGSSGAGGGAAQRRPALGGPPSNPYLSHSRTQVLEMVPLPEKLPEVRQTWKEMCAANWPLVTPAAARPGLKKSSSFDWPGLRTTGAGLLAPHAEADGDEDEDQPPHHHHHHHNHSHHHHHGHHHHGHGPGNKAAAGKRAVMIFRGFRVRMGLHTGIPLTTDVTFNHTTGHMAYSGMPLKVAKAVGDGAAGGSVLLSNTTFNAVHPHLADLPGHPEVLYCGDAQVELIIRSLYMLQPRDLNPRLGYLPALRNLRMLQRGNLEAPVGTVAICFMMVSGATKAVAELGQAAVSALQQFKSIVTRECCECGGFVVEATDGLCLAAFMEPAAAAIWALRSREALASHPWAAELLSSPHFREVREYTKINRGRGLPARRVANVVSRGPRIRTGIAVGPVTAEVSSATARLAYRGKVMNRSARVAAQAADNQVLMSEAAWRRVVATVGLRALSEAGLPGGPGGPPLLSQLSGFSGISGYSSSYYALPESASRLATPHAGGGPPSGLPSAVAAAAAPVTADATPAPSTCPSPRPSFSLANQRTGAINASGTVAGAQQNTLVSKPFAGPPSGLGYGPPGAAAAAARSAPPSSTTAAAAAAAGTAAIGRNFLLAEAERLLSGCGQAGGEGERDREEVEAMVAEAAAVGGALPALPTDHVLVGRSAGRFTLKGVAEPQELFEVRMEHVTAAAAVAASTAVTAATVTAAEGLEGPTSEARSATSAALPAVPAAAPQPAGGLVRSQPVPLSSQPSPLPRHVSQPPGQLSSPVPRAWPSASAAQLQQPSSGAPSGSQQLFLAHPFWSSGPVQLAAPAGSAPGTNFIRVAPFGSSNGVIGGGGGASASAVAFGGEPAAGPVNQDMLSLDGWQLASAAAAAAAAAGGSRGGGDPAAITRAFAAAYAAAVAPPPAPLARAASAEPDEATAAAAAAAAAAAGSSPQLVYNALVAPHRPPPVQLPPEVMEALLGSPGSNRYPHPHQNQHERALPACIAAHGSNTAEDGGRRVTFGPTGGVAAAGSSPAVDAEIEPVRDVAVAGGALAPSPGADPADSPFGALAGAAAAAAAAAAMAAAGASTPGPPVRELAGDALLEALANALINEDERDADPGLPGSGGVGAAAAREEQVPGPVGMQTEGPAEGQAQVSLAVAV